MSYKLHLPKWGDVLIAINNSPSHYRYSERLIRMVQGSITHLREVIKALQVYGLIEIIPKKKIKFLKLTDKGQKVLDAVQIIKFGPKGI